MEEKNNYPFEIKSIELNKKRKLEEEQLGLPIPKHKCLDRYCTAENESPVADDNEVKGNVHIWAGVVKTDGRQASILKEFDSVEDSNSFSEESVNSKVNHRILIGDNIYGNAPVYCASPSINNYKNCYSSSMSASTESGGSSSNFSSGTETAILGDDLKLVQGSDNLSDCEINYTDFTSFEYGKNIDDEEEDMMLYSNGLPSDLYVLSSSLDAGTRLNARKPTIDQEFEQYFSMLML